MSGLEKINLLAEKNDLCPGYVFRHAGACGAVYADLCGAVGVGTYAQIKDKDPGTAADWYGVPG